MSLKSGVVNQILLVRSPELLQLQSGALKPLLTKRTSVVISEEPLVVRLSLGGGCGDIEVHYSTQR